MAELTHFDMQPLQLTEDFRAVTIAPSASKPSRSLQVELDALNDLHHKLISSEEGVLPTRVPGPPASIPPKRAQAVTKLRDQANDLYRKGKHVEAQKMYTAGIEMARARPSWQPCAISREELGGLYANRAQAYMAVGQWAEGSVDAQTSAELRKMGNAKAWWRRGKCLMEMGRLEEASEWVRRALEIEGGEADLRELLEDIEKRLARGKA